MDSENRKSNVGRRQREFPVNGKGTVQDPSHAAGLESIHPARNRKMVGSKSNSPREKQMGLIGYSSEKRFTIVAGSLGIN